MHTSSSTVCVHLRPALPGAIFVQFIPVRGPIFTNATPPCFFRAATLAPGEASPHVLHPPQARGTPTPKQTPDAGRPTPTESPWGATERPVLACTHDAERHAPQGHGVRQRLRHAGPGSPRGVAEKADESG